ncbi:MAG: tRNA modification GTPase, partial [Rickettsiales bacterium]
MTTIFANLGYSLYTKSSLVLFRLSGENSLSSLKFFGIKVELQNRVSTFCNIIDIQDGSIIDQALITYFRSPNSYTGQDVIEISCHPSLFIVNKITNILLKVEGFRYAKEGEFTKLALLNNKIDLIQAEAVLDVINSKTKSQHKQAMMQLTGEHSSVYQEWRQRIVNIVANFESVIDFPDEDLPTEVIRNAEKEVKYLISKISGQLKNNIGQKIKSGISIVILGDPNVGKSTLMNFLNQQDISIVSDVAGTTRDIVQSHLDIAGYEVVISDTAGIRESVNPIEIEGIKRAVNKSKEADIKIIILDLSNLNSSNLEFYDKNTILIINKIDLGNPKLNSELSKKDPILISLEQGINLDQIFIKIKE